MFRAQKINGGVLFFIPEEHAMTVAEMLPKSKLPTNVSYPAYGALLTALDPKTAELFQEEYAHDHIDILVPSGQVASPGYHTVRAFDALTEHAEEIGPALEVLKTLTRF